MTDDRVIDFTFEIDPVEIDDLRDRLARTRWPDQVPGTEWQLGTDIGYLRELCAHWADGFDFAAFVARYNRYPHVRTVIDGVTMHAIVARSDDPDATPLMLVHGWPGSVAEYAEVIEPLRAHHHVVVPSIPGYGFSGPTDRLGIGPLAIAGLFVRLMERLGFGRFVYAGNDWGGIIGGFVGAHHPDAVLGVHLALLTVPPPTAEQLEQMTDDERELTARATATMATGRGYQAIQGSKPQSLAYSLIDSPAGLAGWITEKFHAWSDCGGDLSTVFTFDRLLENISIYWFTRTINSSMRLYYEALGATRAVVPDRPITAPTGHPVYPGEVIHAPRAAAEAWADIVHWERMPRGGHFAAMEVPDLFVPDLLSFIAKLS